MGFIFFLACDISPVIVVASVGVVEQGIVNERQYRCSADADVDVACIHGKRGGTCPSRRHVSHTPTRGKEKARGRRRV